ncbi:MAG: class A beta-lactamase-related serine hydrolase [Bacteroidia bacterium]|nr:class A beta-lactamase-related serine hydrolase [Bacteroidia bacterium]MCF8426118.1 class A beta-lactamase-related serine hydrolase [Bacteroidia bacterium]MCF8446494.1 class A beta-lactamase-related serine hydrolase [Bacteroidia bacterium]
MSKKLFYVLGFVVLVLVFLLGYFMPKSSSKNEKKKMETTNETSIGIQTYPLINPLTPCIEKLGMENGELSTFKPQIDAYIEKVKKNNPGLFVSYYFRDLNNGLWIGINEREKFSPASLFKLPVLITFLKRAEKDPGIFSKGLTFYKKNVEGIEEESGFPKEDGKFYTTEDLLNQMICYSDNAASLILLNFLGEDAVEQTLKEMNIKIEKQYDEKSNFVTVKSYAAMFRIIYNASYLSKEMSQKALALLSQSRYKKGIRSGIPSNIVIAHKYGKRDEHVPGSDKLKSDQLHHFALVYYPKKPFLLGVMTRGASLEVKEKIIHDLAEITYEQVDIQCNNKKVQSVFSE